MGDKVLKVSMVLVYVSRYANASKKASCIEVPIQYT